MQLLPKALQDLRGSTAKILPHTDFTQLDNLLCMDLQLYKHYVEQKLQTESPLPQSISYPIYTF